MTSKLSKKLELYEYDLWEAIDGGGPFGREDIYLVYCLSCDPTPIDIMDHRKWSPFR